MIETIEELKEFFKGIKEKNIIFKRHFYDKKEIERNYLNERLVIDSIKDTNNLLGFQKQVIKPLARNPFALANG